MMTRNLMLIGGAALVMAAAALAQGDDAPRGEALQKALEERAIRIPAAPPLEADEAAAGQGAATRSDEAAPTRARSTPAQLVRRPPDWRQVREDLAATRSDDRAEGRVQDNQGAEASQDDVASTPPSPPPPPPPGLRAAAQSVRARLAAAEIDRVLIPLLIPAALRDDVKIYGMRNIYTATASLDQGAGFSISGTCNRVIGGDPNIVRFRKRISQGPRRLAGLGADYHISRNDFGVDLSFSKFGCGYVITIECGDPGADPRCAADTYITDLADSMILVNAERAESEQ